MTDSSNEATPSMLSEAETVTETDVPADFSVSFDFSSLLAKRSRNDTSISPVPLRLSTTSSLEPRNSDFRDGPPRRS